VTRTVSKRDRDKLASLLAQAGRQRKALDAIHRAVRGITGEEDPYGHSFDAVMSDLGITTDELLRRLGINVKP